MNDPAYRENFSIKLFGEDQLLHDHPRLLRYKYRWYDGVRVAQGLCHNNEGFIHVIVHYNCRSACILCISNLQCDATGDFGWWR